MFKQSLFVAAIASLTLAGCSQAYCHDDPGTGVTVLGCPSVQFRPDATRCAEGLLDEIVTWLSSNFDLPAIKDHPAIELASTTKLATMQAEDSARWQGLTQAEGIDQSTQRRVVALYNVKSKTIFLPDDWIGKSPADQSVLVHEMVHHLQNVAESQVRMPDGTREVGLPGSGQMARAVRNESGEGL